MAQPQATFGDEVLHPGVVDRAAAYLFHLCMAHAFVDGNKRHRVCRDGYLPRLNGYRLVLSDQEAYEITMAVAREEKDEDDLREAIRAAVVPG